MFYNENMKKKYKIGLIIGRFQPFHKGHGYLIKRALERVDKLIIEIGSSNIKNIDNPISYRSRKKLVEIFSEKEGLKNKIIKIIPLPDNPSDEVWLYNAIKRAGDFDVVISNNDENVNIFFKKRGYQVLKFPFYKRYMYEGEKIRELIRRGKDWENRVPNYLVPEIEQSAMCK